MSFLIFFGLVWTVGWIADRYEQLESEDANNEKVRSVGKPRVRNRSSHPVPDTLKHSQMRPLGKIVAAGFVMRAGHTSSGYQTYGSSESLGIASRPDDQKLLDTLLGSKE